jgi:RNA polymerase sigma-70 factor (ECF subfamily)
MTPMSTEGLAQALGDARQGDERAIAVLYRALNPPLLRFLRHHAGPVAEDLASEVWISLARRLRAFGGDDRELRALMFTIARRRVVDEHRRRGRRVATAPLGDYDRPAGDSPEDAVIAGLTAQGAVEALAANLPGDQAEIVLLRVLGDLDVGQVADIVGKSNGAVRVAQHRALQRLREVFDERELGGASAATEGERSA